MNNLFKNMFSAKKQRQEIKEDRKDDPGKMQKDTAFGYSTMSWLFGGFTQMVNPDKLVRLKGAGIYHRMLSDDQVSAAFNLKLNLIMGRDFRFVPADDTQEEIVEFFKRTTEDLISGTWKGAMRSILMGKAYGYSVCEKVFRQAEVNKKLRWVIDKVNLKPYDSIRFSSDKYGNLTQLAQDPDGSGTRLNELDMSKFIIYVNKPEMDPIWGESDLKPAYIPYWEKDVTRKYWNIYSERVAGGFPVLTPNERAGNLGDGRADLEKTIKNVTGLTGIVLPQGYEADIVQAEDTEAFQKKIEHHDKQIARCLLTPPLLGFAEQGKVGSYSQSQTQFEVFMMLINDDCDYLSDVLNEQLFSQLAWWNFKVRDYPRFTFDDYSDNQKREMAKLWGEAIKVNSVTNTVDDELHTRELLRYPTPEADKLEKERERRKPDFIKSGVNPTSGKNDKSKETDEDSSNEEDTKPKEAPKATKQSEDGVLRTGLQPATTFADPSDGNNNDAMQDGVTLSFVSRVDFPVAENQLNSIADSFYNGMADHVDLFQEEIIATIKDVKKSLPKDKTKIDRTEVRNKLSSSIQAKTKASLRKSIAGELRTTYNTGWNIAHKATLKAAKDVDAPKRFINRINSIALMSEQRMCKDEQWSMINFIEGLSLEAANAWFNDQSFKITGDLSQYMVNTAINIMTNGINNDWSTKQIVDEMKGSLKSITGGTDKQERHRLNTIVRTNMSTIFTQAQLAFYNDPDLRGFVEALMYSSIIDTRTTEICTRLDGSVYPINDQIWRFITPPNHHLCRSVLIPVTVLDEWKRDTGTFTENQLPGDGFGKSGLAKMFEISL